MSLVDVLSSYTDKTIEIFLENAFYEGRLISTTDAVITIQTVDSGYYDMGSVLNILLSKINYVRVIHS